MGCFKFLVPIPRQFKLRNSVKLNGKFASHHLSVLLLFLIAGLELISAPASGLCWTCLEALPIGLAGGLYAIMRLVLWKNNWDLDDLLDVFLLHGGRC